MLTEKKEFEETTGEAVKVTVVCMAYNHGKYIRNCLEGFVNQKTNFKYEVIVHDDASTDNTASIIKEYEEKYPTIIKPIYQTVNQHRLKVDKYKNFVLPHLKGQYVALCEGDDYWVDENKLQAQADALDHNRECHLCLHKVVAVDADDGSQKGSFPANDFPSGIIKSDEFVPKVIKEYTFQTSSYFFDGDLFRNYVTDYPQFRRIADVGDVPYLLFFGYQGDVYYIDQVMSHYRVSSSGSWTERNRSSEAAIRHIQTMTRVFEEYDKYTDYRFHTWCEQRVKYNNMYLAFWEKRYRDVLNAEYKEIFRNEPSKFKLATYIGRYFGRLYPSIYKLYSRVKYGKK